MDTRSRIGLVEQHAPVLHGSLRDNLTYAAPDAGEDDIHQSPATPAQPAPARRTNLQPGHLTAAGTHDELQRTSPIYRGLTAGQLHT